MAPACVGPGPPVVVVVVHHVQHIHDPGPVVDPADQSVAVIAHVEDDAVANDVGRPEGLLHRAEVVPEGPSSDLIPGREKLLGVAGVGLPRLPEFNQLGPLDDPQARPPAFCSHDNTRASIAFCDRLVKSSSWRGVIVEDDDFHRPTGLGSPRVSRASSPFFPLGDLGVLAVPFFEPTAGFEPPPWNSSRSERKTRLADPIG